MAKEVSGWAVVEPGGFINIRTVCESRRAALVNWLVTEKKLFITVFDTDDAIERWWGTHSGDRTCSTVVVSLAP